jgi:hypothetical protein
MNAKLFLPACLLAIALPAIADEPQPVVNGSASTEPLRWNSDARHWDHLLIERDKLPPMQQLPPLKLGKSGFNIGGPLVNTFRRRPHPPDRTFARKVLDLPVINLFVPGPMDNPPRTGGSYFAWRGERVGPLRSASPGGASATMGFHNHEPTASLISIGK